MTWSPEGSLNAFIVGAIITVALRWYARVRILKRTGLEDFLVTAALVSARRLMQHPIGFAPLGWNLHPMLNVWHRAGCGSGMFKRFENCDPIWFRHTDIRHTNRATGNSAQGLPSAINLSFNGH